MLHILSTGTTKLNNVNELLIDPSAILVAALADRIVAFKEQQTGTNMDDAESLPSAFVKACVNSNVVDHLLLRVGHLQGETSRNLDWAENYEKPPVLIAQSDMSFSGISNKALTSLKAFSLDKNFMILGVKDNTKSSTGSDGKSLVFRLKQTARLGQLKSILSQRSGIAKEQLLFVSQDDKILEDNDSVASCGLKTNQIFCYMKKDWSEQHVVKPSVFNKRLEVTPIQEISTSENINGSSDTTNSNGLGSMWKPGFGHGSNNSATADNDREAQKVRKLSATIECLETLHFIGYQF